MKNYSLKHLCLQVFLLIIIAVVSSASNTTVRVEAQLGCTEPPLYTGNNPARYSWSPNHAVDVQLDALWNESDRSAFAAGAAKWNNWKTYNCSGITFSGFSARTFSDYSAPPPIYTVRRKTLLQDVMLMSYSI